MHAYRNYLEAEMFACCDESGTHQESRWWALGAMWLPDDDQLAEYEANATRLRQRTGCWGEFKWSKVGPGHLDAYQEFLGLTLALPDLRYTSMVVDTKLFTKKDLAKYHGGSKNLAYLKCMRDLIRWRIRHWAAQGHREFTLLYDKQAVKGKLATDFHDVVSSDMRNLATRVPGSSYKHLSPVNSATLHLLQATDLITGATRNAWEKDAASEKKEAARQATREQIEDWAGGKLTYEYFKSDRYYSLWRWKPREPAKSSS
jgi:uncharacterized protein DUF3800